MATKKQLLWQLFFSYLFITLISLVAVTWYASQSVRNSLLKQMETDLYTRALLFESLVLDHFESPAGSGIDAFSKKLGTTVATRFTVILPWGKVVADSDHDPSQMDNHLDRPEIEEALNSGRGISTRYSPTLHKKMMYVAVTLKKNERIVAVVRTSLPLNAIDETLRGIELKIALAGLIIAAFAAVLSLLVFRRIRNPIEEMKRGAEAFARGEFQHRLALSEWEEMSSLGETMNQMAAELRDRINMITSQRNELEAVLSSMVEGVIAVDTEEHIISMNQAAGGIFDCSPLEAQGRSIQEMIRNPDFQKLVSEALASDAPVQKDLIFYAKEEERVLSGYTTLLKDAESRRKGILVVLNDVTRLRKLENVRRDFVANVSHEIKTPLTAIKGFVETLRDEAAKSPEEADRFLRIVEKHVDRLEAIVEDLLSLSRIEGEEERGEIVLEHRPVSEVLLAAAQAVQVKAESKNIPLRISCGEDVKAKINSPLIEQALVNLLDNALKYSEPGKEVVVDVEDKEKEKEILIHVHDQGCGIERIHLDRLFERFYRVDKARSRKLGGTGLGLSIVKHIMQAHGGSVSVKSRPGLGSTFTLHLPGMASNHD
jgi:two-component system phosphate regulon sensor histidine kinase PhoR